MQSAGIFLPLNPVVYLDTIYNQPYDTDYSRDGSQNIWKLCEEFDMPGTLRNWLARILVAPVVFFNLQCAFLFIWKPAQYSASYELTGVVGVIVVSGFGILFLMWNVPYLFALVDPTRHRTSLHEAVIMQTIGLLGEILLLFSLSAAGEHTILASSITRFIWFDGGGWLLLMISVLIFAREYGAKAYEA
jgi:hypothetical protein